MSTRDNNNPIPYPTNGAATDLRISHVEERVLKLENRTENVNVLAEQYKNLTERISELEGAVKWLMRSTIGLAGVIAAAAGIIARGGG